MIATATQRTELEPIERRSETRFLQHSRVLQLTVNGTTHPFIVCNISSKGTSGRCIVSLLPGTPFVLTFENGAAVAGSVQWTTGGMSGMRFLTPIGSDLIFMRDRPPQKRAPRFPVARPASIAYRDAVRRGMIRNVSNGGMLIETVGSLRPGQMIEVSAGKIVTTGQVRWSNGNFSGLKLIEPLCLGTFEAGTLGAAIDLRHGEIGQGDV